MAAISHFLRRASRISPQLPAIAVALCETPLNLSIRFLSSSSNDHSFAVSYLVNTVGFSPESALLASKRVNFETREKPDSVIDFFESQGFSKSQISKLVAKFPRVLSANPEKTLLPKLLFFKSKGLSSPEISKLLCAFPAVLKRSLSRQIIPAFDYIQNLLQSEKKTVAAIKRFLGLLTWDLQIYARPNIEMLREIGVPDSNISTILAYQPRMFLINSSRFKEIVQEVKDMGFNPQRMKFVLGVFALRALSKSTWKRKIEAYRKWDWPEEEILLAFRRHPWCMMASENKINAVMDFFVNEMGCKPSTIAKRPALISLSLKKRIIPRSSVYQALLSKGLVKKDINLPSLLDSSEELFLDKFIKPYKKLVPGLLKLYKKKLEVSKV